MLPEQFCVRMKEMLGESTQHSMQAMICRNIRHSESIH